MSEICPHYSPGPWKFTGECKWDKNPDHTCDYCGSMHPEDLLARIEAGTVFIGATDKNYKIYVTNDGGAPFKQTYRNCPRDAKCTGPDDCTHWVTRERDDSKFYFQHFTELSQRQRFIDLYNSHKMKFRGGDFYVLPYFVCAEVKPK
ncbi:MAG: hypothetical protein KGL39_24560 [Patescibacteria group bacterium]|nr:hypothetical protein [Patescibacteria group bacterium]